MHDGCRTEIDIISKHPSVTEQLENYKYAEYTITNKTNIVYVKYNIYVSLRQYEYDYVYYYCSLLHH